MLDILRLRVQKQLRPFSSFNCPSIYKHARWRIYGHMQGGGGGRGGYSLLQGGLCVCITGKSESDKEGDGERARQKDREGEEPQYTCIVHGANQV